MTVSLSLSFQVELYPQNHPDGFMLKLSLYINVFLLLLKVFRCSLRRAKYSPQIQAVNEDFKQYLSEDQPLRDSKLSSQAGMLCSEMCHVYLKEKSWEYLMDRSVLDTIKRSCIETKQLKRRPARKK